MTKKRVLFLGLCSVLCAVFVILCGCSRTKKNTDLQSTASRACVVDDTSALKDVLTKKYDIEQLKEFFKNSYTCNSINIVISIYNYLFLWS